VRRERKQIRVDDRSWDGGFATTSARRFEPEESIEIQEQRLECLERCLHELNPDQRTLVIEYYRDAPSEDRAPA
jgi:DNA-directed RNA polymerase specialized sigma24 family protein